MFRKNKLPELLSPAGDMQCLYAAVAGGADAVYVGGRSFGARAYAKNFDISELEYAVSYCHLHNVKLYVTVNTLIYDKELSELSDFLFELWRIGVDAVITADLGVICEIKRRVPSLPIHASTQMSVHNTHGADVAAKLGCERVVLARELSQKNIMSVSKKCRIETEVFLHGALCVSHSGQCLMSSMIGGRSGNRGECAQPCRLPYNNRYPLSLSDLSLSSHISELIDSGVASLKIEGRMKSPEYVYTVTSIYRKLLDEGRNASAEENDRLKKVFSRGGFTDGYFKGAGFENMTGVRSEADKENTKKLEEKTFEPEKIKICAEAEFVLGKPSRLTLKTKDRSVTVYGDTPTVAINSPLNRDGVKSRLSKMGQTLFSLAENDVNVIVDHNINLPPSAINALRRDGASKLSFFGRESVSSNFSPEKLPIPKRNKMKTAVFMNKKSYFDALSNNEDVFSFFDIAFLPLSEYCGETNGVYIPPVVLDSEEEEILRLLHSAKKQGAKYALVSNLGHISLAESADLLPIGDFRLNITNSYAKQTLSELGVENSILSAELTLPMLRDIGGGCIVYGRIPLMLTERCFIKENFGCDKCSKAELSDRTGKKFPILREYGHRNIILNTLPTYMGDKSEELNTYKISHGHFIFTTESGEEIKRVISSYQNGEVLSCDVRRIGKR